MNDVIDLHARRRVAELVEETPVPAAPAQAHRPSTLKRITILRETLVAEIMEFLVANGVEPVAKARFIADRIIDNAMASEMRASMAKPPSAPRGPAA